MKHIESTEQKRRIAVLYKNLTNALLSEDNLNPHEQITGEITETYFIDLLLAFHMHFKYLTQNESIDLLDFIAILNRLLFQFLTEKGGDDD